MSGKSIVTAIPEEVGRLYDRFGEECLDLGAAEEASNFGFGEHLHFGYWETPDEDISLDIAAIRLTDMVIDRLKVDHTHHVLDIGCGVGGPALRMARRTGARVTGISVSQDQITEAVAVGESGDLAGRVDFRLADALDLPFPDDSFDAAFALESVIHMPDRRRVLQEISRVLRPGGRLVLTDFFERAPIPAVKLPVVKRLLEGSMMTTVKVENYPPMLRDVGFMFEEIVDISAHTTRRTFMEMSKVWTRANPDFDLEDVNTLPDPCPGMVDVEGFGYLLLVARRT
ncbi:MAG: Ubiquinone/menaquinone biosynthesis C-methylase UbiE [Amycolatopsis sp.]|uniref:SAM-dependent methyltransferase n=1 Tax=Amycolatopsis sp. TaxID=37632 RepID=UPI00262AA041|nr:methyltransferase domain-containing protein [Amycolatopsis sp.]MCU1687957.1 Ubiquinone/menaquinone biosynthesis C-methylase UbiE [Amycolatopsis sp.]